MKDDKPFWNTLIDVNVDVVVGMDWDNVMRTADKALLERSLFAATHGNATALAYEPSFGPNRERIRLILNYQRTIASNSCS